MECILHARKHRHHWTAAQCIASGKVHAIKWIRELSTADTNVMFVASRCQRLWVCAEWHLNALVATHRKHIFAIHSHVHGQPKPLYLTCLTIHIDTYTRTRTNLHTEVNTFHRFDIMRFRLFICDSKMKRRQISEKPPLKGLQLTWTSMIRSQFVRFVWAISHRWNFRWLVETCLHAINYLPSLGS